MRIIKIPSSLGKGTEKAPDKVMANTQKLDLSENGCLPAFDQDKVEIVQDNIQETNKNIYNKSLQAFKETNKPLFLGGDHSVTSPIVRAFAETFPGKPGIIIFDAHPDAENESMPDSQEDLLCCLINQNIIRPENIILVGTRNWNKNEIEFIKKNNIRYFPMQKIAKYGKQEISETIMENAKDFSALYISIDIDVLDPAFAPGTGCLEPGGLSTRELLFFLHRLKNMHNLKGFDLVEINPDKDVNDMTSKVGAKILVELC
ncbi:MAG: arginase family protein [Nanoarchaeota archaeon]